ncbi:MAG: BatA domain-containing protein [Planctomycetes bacterium]|nr:BatA domain-containing protein [Planctomycetota bacterium]
MGNWIGGFVNPALLAGLAAVTLPLLIHLLNRQRHKPMRWAAMRFVLAAYKKTRRRVELENLLLLLLRMGAVALLALALARPFTGRDSPLAGLTDTRRDVVVVLDASASTGQREGVDSVFERERERARALAREVSGAHGDRLRLIVAGAYPRLVSWTTPEQALSLLDTLENPTGEPLDLAGALAEVLRLAKETQNGGSSSLEVHLLSDMQRRSFLPYEGAQVEKNPRSRALDEVLDGLTQLGVRVIVEDLCGGERVPPNLSITGVRTLGEIYAAGLPSEIAVSVANRGAQARVGVRVSLSVDGERRPSQLVDLEPRASADAVFTLTFAKSGEHMVVASVEGDRLAIDNERAQVFEVPDSLRVLLVDGQPSSSIEEDEVGLLRTVLDPPLDDTSAAGAAPAPFLPTVMHAEELGNAELSLANYDAVWLANLDRVTQPVAERLSSFVSAGGLLVVSCGDAMDLGAWNQRMFKADGDCLLPAELVRKLEIPVRGEAHWRVSKFDAEHPALAFFADERFQLLLTEAPIFALIGTQPLPQARVLASLDDPAQSAFLIERPYLRGRVILWTTSIDDAWTRIPDSPGTLVPLVHELLRYGARAEAPRRNLAPGEPLEIETTGAFPRNLALVLPDGARRALEGEVVQAVGGKWKLPNIEGKQLERVGAYRIEREGADPIPFSVQLDAREGDLERLPAEEVAQLHSAFVQANGDPGSQPDKARPDRGELWRGLALACLVFLCLESLWAAWLGRKRRVA